MQNSAQTLDTLQTPCLLLDEGRLRANVARMKAHLGGLGVAFRPHLKTAKCAGWAKAAPMVRLIRGTGSAVPTFGAFRRSGRAVSVTACR
jgi:D-serine deaminase-like pyridoxal phosphate-dependent protein